MAESDWKVYEKLVISKLEEHAIRQRAHGEILRSLEIEFARLKIKSSLWGFIAGSIPILATTIYQFFK